MVLDKNIKFNPLLEKLLIGVIRVIREIRCFIKRLRCLHDGGLFINEASRKCVALPAGFSVSLRTGAMLSVWVCLVVDGLLDQVCASAGLCEHLFGDGA